MRKLGQHFLTNPSVTRKIIAALEIQRGGTVIEIGPGHGELTTAIAEQGVGRLIAIEKDAKLAGQLEKKYKTDGHVKIILGDALEAIPKLTRSLSRENYALAGNIPYYLTGRLFRILGALKNRPLRTVFTVQREVADRIAASPPKMNRLAASVQWWALPSIVGIAAPKDFAPQPKVSSAIVLLRRKEPQPELDGCYEAALQLLFRQPRKTVLNNLRKKGSGASALEALLWKYGINPRNRPGGLRIEDIAAIGHGIVAGENCTHHKGKPFLI
jgi:16S rRNA (adenine1518-N6/adenine1519-N6)-dimethyltransferase